MKKRYVLERYPSLGGKAIMIKQSNRLWWLRILMFFYPLRTGDAIHIRDTNTSVAKK